MTRRTTLAADADDLAVLEGEARRRGVSLAQVLRETVAEIHKQNAHTPHEELMELIDGELAEVRRPRRGLD